MAEMIRYTPYADLKTGDEFIRLGGLPILLKDIPGRRVLGGRFWPTGFQYAPHIRVMRNRDGVLQEEFLND